MKNVYIALAFIAPLTLAPRPAAAMGDRETAILGGVIGGAIVGLAIDDALNNDTRGTRYRHGYGRDHSRYYGHSRYSRYYGHSHPQNCSCSVCRSSTRLQDRNRSRYLRNDGHWTYRSVRVWVPQRTWYSHDRNGCRIRHHERGYWTFRRERVWVSGRNRW